MFAEDSKALELSGAGSDDLQETEDIKLAREELKVLHDEKHRTEKLRATVMKELEQARVKTRHIEEVKFVLCFGKYRYYFQVKVEILEIVLEEMAKISMINKTFFFNKFCRDAILFETFICKEGFLNVALRVTYNFYID